jgi:hypothetical protein
VKAGGTQLPVGKKGDVVAAGYETTRNVRSHSRQDPFSAQITALLLLLPLIYISAKIATDPSSHSRREERRKPKPPETTAILTGEGLAGVIDVFKDQGRKHGILML